MTALFVPLLLATALVATVLGGPRLLRAAVPALVRVPRLAVALLLGAAGLWLLTAAALSLMLAWLVTGPVILPAGITGVCQRCLAAATPFGSAGTIDTVIPAALPLLLPLMALLVLSGIGITRGLQRRRATRDLARDVVSRARHATILGHRVVLTDAPALAAYSLPRRHGGIVVSDRLTTALHPDELAAILAHEEEHVRGRHHLVLAILHTVVAPLRWLPLMSAILAAVPLYLEIAADHAARRSAGTTALASALLKLGELGAHAAGTPRPAVASVLHAAGPDRIRHLVAPERIRSAIIPLAALSVAMVSFVVAAATVYGPYVSVIAAGCVFPA